jgi:hypothetical protein
MPYTTIQDGKDNKTMAAGEAGEIDGAWRYALVRKAHPTTTARAFDHHEQCLCSVRSKPSDDSITITIARTSTSTKDRCWGMMYRFSGLKQ